MEVRVWMPNVHFMCRVYRLRPFEVWSKQLALLALSRLLSPMSSGTGLSTK